MEQPSNLEDSSEEKGEQELSLEEKLALTEALFEANDRRNKFVVAHGGDFDTFAESWANLPEVREVYDDLANKAEEARKALDEAILDKAEFVEQLKNAGREDYADRIASIFLLSKKIDDGRKDGVISRIRKKFSK